MKSVTSANLSTNLKFDKIENTLDVEMKVVSSISFLGQTLSDLKELSVILKVPKEDKVGFVNCDRKEFVKNILAACLACTKEFNFLTRDFNDKHRMTFDTLALYIVEFTFLQIICPF